MKMSWVEPELAGMPSGHEADHRPDAYWEGEQLILRASSLGGCSKAIIAAGMGLAAEAPPAKIRGAWAESAALESEVIAKGLDWAWAELGVKFKLLDPKVGTDRAGHPLKPMEGQWGFDMPVGENVRLRGHVDGIGASYMKRNDAEDLKMVVIEAKAFGDDYWGKWKDTEFESFPSYELQWTAYRMASELPGLYVVGHKRDGKIIEVDVGLWERPVPTHAAGKLLGRAKIIANRIKADNLPDECDISQWPCPMWYLHAEEEQLDDLDPEVEGLAEEYRQLQLLIKADQDRLKVLKQLLIDKVGMRKGKAGKWRVNVYASEYPEKTRTTKAYTATTVRIEEL